MKKNKPPEYRWSNPDRSYLLKMNEELCRVLIEEARDGIYIIGEKGFEYVNAGFARMTEFSREEILENGTELIFRQVHPDDREMLLKRKEVLSRGEQLPPVYKIRVFTKSGRLIHLEFNTTPISGGRVVGVVRDVTEQINLREQLKERESISSRLIENARAAIVIVQDGKIKFANKATSDIFGYSLAEIIGSRIDAYLPENKACEVFELYRKRLTGESRLSHYELKVHHKNGQMLWIEVDVSLIEYNGSPATLMVIHNITERKRTEDKLKEALGRLRQAFGATIDTLNKLVEIKDPYTGGHQRRVADLARLIATEMGLSPEQIDGLRLAAQIHDIGKIAVPSEILSKPGKLSESEWGLVRNHAQIGYNLLKDIDFPWPVAEIIYQHHERLDGSGYPLGLTGDQIMIEAKILAVADVVEAMSSHRPYREAYTLEEALREIENNRGRLYDEKVVETCLRLFREKGYKLKK